MDLTSKLELLGKAPTEEILIEQELAKLLETVTKPRMYIGFEISGKVHLGTGIICMSKVKDFQDAGFECIIFLADWHSWINKKLGGELNVIREVAGGYFKHALSESLRCVGGVSSRVRFVMGSEIYDTEFWAMVIRVSQELTLKRVQRMLTIMGRRENEAINFAQLIYPPMQIADIFNLNVNVAHGGMDQRKAHVGAREVAQSLGKEKPIALHHHLLQGLTQPPIWPIPKNTNLREIRIACKMSKSKPKTCIFIHDSAEEIRRKIKEAFCPERTIEFNPIIDIVRHIIFRFQKNLKVGRPQKFGGDIEFKTADEVKTQFGEGKLHPADLKNAVAEELINILKPARKHFERHSDLLSIFSRRT